MPLEYSDIGYIPKGRKGTSANMTLDFVYIPPYKDSEKVVKEFQSYTDRILAMKATIASTTTTTTTTTTTEDTSKDGGDDDTSRSYAKRRTVKTETMKRDFNPTIITMNGINIDDKVIDAMIRLSNAKVEVLGPFSETAYWDKLQMSNCTGDVGRAIMKLTSPDFINVTTNETTTASPRSLVRHVGIQNRELDIAAVRAAGNNDNNAAQGPPVTNVDCTALNTVLLRSTSRLQSLKLWSKIHQETDVIKLAEGIKNCPTLKELQFNWCFLNDHTQSLVLQAMQDHPELENLIMYNHGLGPKSSAALASMLASSLCKVKRLEICCRNTLTGWRQIMDGLRSNTSSTLQELNLRECKLNDTDITAVAEMLTQNTSIKDVNLGRNSFTDRGIQSFASMLPSMKGMKEFTLFGISKMTDVGARYLLEGLKTNTELCRMDLNKKFDCSLQLQHYTTINVGGRKLLSDIVACNDDDDDDHHHQDSSTTSTSTARPGKIAISILPRVFERINTKVLDERLEDLCTPKQRRLDMTYHMLRNSHFWVHTTTSTTNATGKDPNDGILKKRKVG